MGKQNGPFCSVGTSQLLPHRVDQDAQNPPGRGGVGFYHVLVGRAISPVRGQQCTTPLLAWMSSCGDVAHAIAPVGDLQTAGGPI